MVVSAANGKIKTVTKEGNNYRITFEQENTFVAHDLMRCAVLRGQRFGVTGWKCRKATRKG